ncbi:Uncharacterized protein YyaL [hydrothermal vent metagenome]|uniref:Uncharacterized protein YyaL n=1 Tax=hydrothermal vent metagenome TaxID=652676 RepID=A0A3B0W205_9ZZZZ
MIHPTPRDRRQTTTQSKEGFHRPLLTTYASTWMLFSTLLFLLATLSVNSIASTQNALHQHDSPYLAMHGKDPVHWQIWNATILKRATAENKLIFISSGYFSCHWCHVMHRESYLDPLTAKTLNQHFISVKIDRELNPELDKVLIEFSQRATGQAGWPQHVVLTPDGYPFAAFIYLSNKDFNTTLSNIITLWNEHPNQIQKLAKNFLPPPAPAISQPLSVRQFQTQLLQQLAHREDDFSGGLTSRQGSSKFPHAPLLQSLLNSPTLPKATKEWLILTLDQMQSQHLMDHIHGGFYRYTIDPEWQTPHFEKMAYTNALLAKLYFQAGTRFQRPDYITTAQQTLTYLNEHLYNPATQLYQSSQSAIDAKNQEGGDYLWTKEALQKALSPTDFALIQTEWHLEQLAPYELGWLPKPPSKISPAQWQRIRHALQTPAKQIPIDSKSILSWNGLILSAYAQAYQTLNTPNIRQKGDALAKRLNQLIQQKNPPRALSQQGNPMGHATLEDYAFIYQGLKDWQTTTETSYAPQIAALEKTILRQFLNATGWQYQAIPLLPGQQSHWQMKDDAIPSPAAIVSCLKPEALSFASASLLKDPIAYASYTQPLTQCGQTVRRTAQPTSSNQY